MKLKLKKDLVIPKGTEFRDCNGLMIEYGEASYEKIMPIGKDATYSIFIGGEENLPEMDELFEKIK